MATIIKTAIHLLLIADPTQAFFLIRYLKLHDPLSVPLPLAEATGIDITGLGIDHFALTVWVVVRPAAVVGIAVCEAHAALPGFHT